MDESSLIHVHAQCIFERNYSVQIDYDVGVIIISDRGHSMLLFIVSGVLVRQGYQRWVVKQEKEKERAKERDRESESEKERAVQSD